MKKPPLAIIACLALAGAVAWWSHSKPKPSAASEKQAAESKETSHTQPSAHGVAALKVDVATQTRMGLQTAAISELKLRPSVEAMARVLDPASLVALVNELAVAEAEWNSNQRELERTRLLATQENASQRSLQVAELAAEKSRLQVEGIRLRLTSAWGSTIAAHTNLAEFTRALASNASVLIRIDVPMGVDPKSPPVAARVAQVVDDAEPVLATLLGTAPTIDPQMQGRSFLGVVNSNSINLRPGAALACVLELAGETQGGVMVPRNAILRFQGDACVYRQEGDESFARIRIDLERPLPQGWFVRAGLKPGDRVVTRGAAQLLSEQTQGEGEPE